MYKVAKFESDSAVMIVREDGLWIPVDTANGDYQQYLAWLEDGNTPEPWEPEQ